MATSKRTRVGGGIVLSAALFTSVACGNAGADGEASGSAEGLPEGNIEMVIPYAPGGTTDPLARGIGDLLADELGTGISYTNTPGAGGVLGVTEVTTGGQTDGLRMVFAPNSTLALQPIVNPDVQYRSTEAYDAFARIAQAPSVIAVRADAPWDTLEDLIDDAKSRPGEIRVATTGAGSARHATVAALNKDAGIELQPTFFTGGTGESIIAVVQGSVEVVTTDLTPLLGQLEAGELKLLGVASDEPLKDYPDVQTFEELGLTFSAEVSQSDYYLVLPNGVPDGARQELEEAITAVLASEEWKAFAEENGFEVPDAGIEPEDALDAQAENFEELAPELTQ